MVIDSNTNINTSGGTQRNRVDSGSDASQKSGGGNVDAKTDQAAKTEVSLSSQAQTLSRLESSIQNTDDVDSDRVTEIKKAIADGSFEINAERIADKMLAQDELFR